MRRDICYYYNAPVSKVYQGYLSAAGNNQFRRECREEPYHTLTFGLNFSMKYNFNGGSCVIRFIPWQNGTAVNLRFSLAQAAGARYEWYDRDLTAAASAIIGVVAQPTKGPVDYFLNPANQVVANAQAPSAPQPTPIPVPAPAPVAAPAPASAPAAPQGMFCIACGRQLPADAAFCCYCGVAAPPKEHRCSACGKVNPDDAKFCAYCGNKF